MITIAFYKGRAGHPWHRLQDWAVRVVTGSVYSHCELIEGRAATGRSYLCYSASGRDGGVRAKEIWLDPAKWDLATVSAPRAGARIRAVMGARYDYHGVFLVQLLGLRYHHPSRWFCSELLAYVLGYQRPHRLSPGALARDLGL